MNKLTRLCFLLSVVFLGATADVSLAQDSVWGCTNPAATNYNPDATSDDGSCSYPPETIYGCNDPSALNYNPSASMNDGSCQYWMAVYGCTDSSALNWNPNATQSDGTCQYWTTVYGCTDSSAVNWNPSATQSDGTCQYSMTVYGCTDPGALNYNMSATQSDGTCQYPLTVYGCTDPGALNYNASATQSDGTCQYPSDVYGCTDPVALNYNASANKDDGNCQYGGTGDGSCLMGDPNNNSLTGDNSNNNNPTGGGNSSFGDSGTPSGDYNNNTPTGDNSNPSGDNNTSPGDSSNNAPMGDNSSPSGDNSTNPPMGDNSNPNPPTDNPNPSGDNSNNGGSTSDGSGGSPGNNGGGGGDNGGNTGGGGSTGGGGGYPDQPDDPPIIYGCMDKNASNYDELAGQDDGSCQYPPSTPVRGCTNPKATNYNKDAIEDDGSCVIKGCTDPSSDNYDAAATEDDGSCINNDCVSFKIDPVKRKVVHGDSVIFRATDIQDRNGQKCETEDFNWTADKGDPLNGEGLSFEWKAKYICWYGDTINVIATLGESHLKADEDAQVDVYDENTEKAGEAIETLYFVAKDRFQTAYDDYADAWMDWAILTGNYTDDMARMKQVSAAVKENGDLADGYRNWTTAFMYKDIGEKALDELVEWIEKLPGQAKIPINVPYNSMKSLLYDVPSNDSASLEAINNALADMAVLSAMGITPRDIVRMLKKYNFPKWLLDKCLERIQKDCEEKRDEYQRQADLWQNEQQQLLQEMDGLKKEIDQYRRDLGYGGKYATALSEEKKGFQQAKEMFKALMKDHPCPGDDPFIDNDWINEWYKEISVKDF